MKHIRSEEYNHRKNGLSPAYPGSNLGVCQQPYTKPTKFLPCRSNDQRLPNIIRQRINNRLRSTAHIFPMRSGVPLSTTILFFNIKKLSNDEEKKKGTLKSNSQRKGMKIRRGFKEKIKGLKRKSNVGEIKDSNICEIV
jgi:hypothetical protein